MDHIEQGHLSHPENGDIQLEHENRRESDATFAATRLGRFLSNRHSFSKEDANHIEDQAGC